MTITASTRLCASLGHWPANRQTTSPIMHNAAFEKLGLDYRRFVFQPADVGAAMAAVRTELCRRQSDQAVQGRVIAYLDELDPVAAVNLVHNVDGYLTGYNCDWIGAAGALAEKCELTGQRVAVLGSGGAARAVIYGLRQGGCAVRVFSRSEAKGRALPDGLGASYGGQVGDVAAAAPGILVNATSIGNDLRSDVPVPDAVFATARIVMDVVTRPGRSALLVRAAAAGARTIGGARMLVLQGAFAFEQLTGHQAPVATMQQAVERALGA